MVLEINKKYKFRIRVDTNELVYTGTVISLDEGFVEFKDKFGEIIAYNKALIISYEEVKE
jgi:hypothetical protein